MCDLDGVGVGSTALVSEDNPLVLLVFVFFSTMGVSSHLDCSTKLMKDQEFPKEGTKERKVTDYLPRLPSTFGGAQAWNQRKCPLRKEM